MIFLGANALLIAACLYDSDDRCRNERVYKEGFCVCPAGTTEVGEECVKKTEAPGGLGVECSEDNPCTDDKFSVCHVEGDKAGYCTSQGCTADDECGGDYYCATAAEPSFCRRMPTGVGMMCETQDDCADFDANYCIRSASGQGGCVVANCEDDVVCAPGLKCQDISKFLPGTPKICIMPLGV